MDYSQILEDPGTGQNHSK